MERTEIYELNWDAYQESHRGSQSSGHEIPPPQINFPRRVGESPELSKTKMNIDIGAYIPLLFKEGWLREAQTGWLLTTHVRRLRVETTSEPTTPSAPNKVASRHSS
jgi:hypothetical protein